MKKIALLLIITPIIFAFGYVSKPKVIQIDVSSILNARPVTVLYHGKLIGWTTGIDGGGSGDGYLTKSAALFNGDKNPHALSDNPVFAVNSFHPEIKLHYSNADTTNNQTRNIAGEAEFSFDVPKHNYSGMFLCLTSSEGASQLQFQLLYTDGTDSMNFLLPDYYNNIPANDTISYLAHDLAKWNHANKMAETDHHNIDVVNIHPNPKRVLTAVKVKKAKAGYLVFWGATGVMRE
jgi:hypothetical protein